MTGASPGRGYARAERLTPAAQRAIARFEAQIITYNSSPSICGDILSSTPHDALNGIVADAMHWAKAHGVKDSDVLFFARSTVEVESGE